METPHRRTSFINSSTHTPNINNDNHEKSQMISTAIDETEEQANIGLVAGVEQRDRKSKGKAPPPPPSSYDEELTDNKNHSRQQNQIIEMDNYRTTPQVKKDQQQEVQRKKVVDSEESPERQLIHNQQDFDDERFSPEKEQALQTLDDVIQAVEESLGKSGSSKYIL